MHTKSYLKRTVSFREVKEILLNYVVSSLFNHDVIMMLRLTGDLPYPSYRGIISLPRKQRLVIFFTATHNVAAGMDY